MALVLHFQVSIGLIAFFLNVRLPPNFDRRKDSARMRKQLQVKINLLISTRTLFRHLKYELNNFPWPDLTSD